VLLVLDEPYAGLDDEARAGLASVFSRLRDEREMATVVVSQTSTTRSCWAIG